MKKNTAYKICFCTILSGVNFCKNVMGKHRWQLYSPGFEIGNKCLFKKLKFTPRQRIFFTKNMGTHVNINMTG